LPGDARSRAWHRRGDRQTREGVEARGLEVPREPAQRHALVEHPAACGKRLERSRDAVERGRGSGEAAARQDLLGASHQHQQRLASLTLRLAEGLGPAGALGGCEPRGSRQPRVEVAARRPVELVHGPRGAWWLL